MYNKDYYLFITTLSMMSVLGLMSSDIYLPALPLMSNFFKVANTEIQLTLSAYLFGLAISQVIYGSLSDRYGRKKILIVGISLYVVSSVLCSCAQDIFHLITFRFFQAVGACSGMVIGRAIVADLYKPEMSARIFSTIFPIIGVSPAISPIIGGFLTTYYGWKANFVFLFLFGLILLTIIIFTLKETLSNNKRVNVSWKNLVYNYGKLIRSPLYILYSIIVCSAYGAYFTYLANVPYIFSNYNFQPKETGCFYISISLTYISGNLISKKVIKRKSIDQALILGIVAFIVGGSSMFMLSLKNINNVFAIIIPMSILTYGNGFLLPLGVASVISIFPSIAGTASGFMGLLQLCSASIATIIVGHVSNGEILSMAFMIVIFNAIATMALGCIYLYKKRIIKTEGTKKI